MGKHGKGSELNVLIITEEDVFYVYEFFKVFFPLAKKAEYQIRAITILAPFNKKSNFALAKQMYGFYGPLRFIRVGLQYVLKKIAGATIGNLSRKYNVGFLEAENVNDPEYIKKIREMNIDSIVSIAAPQIFKRELLQSVKYGCINSHSALLPENKGMMPVFWGMFKGDSEIGVTIHYMEEKLDAGNIIKQERIKGNNKSLHEMILKTKRISAVLMNETLTEIMSGSSTSTPMPSGGSYQTFPTPSEVKEFKRRGKKIF